MHVTVDIAHPYLGVEVVVDEAVNDGRDLGLDQGLADRLWHKS